MRFGHNLQSDYSRSCASTSPLEIFPVISSSSSPLITLRGSHILLQTPTSCSYCCREQKNPLFQPSLPHILPRPQIHPSTPCQKVPPKFQQPKLLLVLLLLCLKRFPSHSSHHLSPSHHFSLFSHPFDENILEDENSSSSSFLYKGLFSH